MKCNVGVTDAVLRIVAGIVVIVFGWYYKSWWGAIGLIPLLTGIFRWCPLYIPLKISTVKEKKE